MTVRKVAGAGSNALSRSVTDKFLLCVQLISSGISLAWIICLPL